MQMAPRCREGRLHRAKSGVRGVVAHYRKLSGGIQIAVAVRAVQRNLSSDDFVWKICANALGLAARVARMQSLGFAQTRNVLSRRQMPITPRSEGCVPQPAAQRRQL